MDRTYSTLEVARQLGVSVQSVQRWVDLGRLRAWVTPGVFEGTAGDAEALFREHSQRQPVVAAPVPDRPDPAASALIVDANAMDRELAVLQLRQALPNATITVHLKLTV